MESCFVIKWPFSTERTYNYGSVVQFDKGHVQFANQQMSPGAKIHTWKSKASYQDQIELIDLPLLKPATEYNIFCDIQQRPAGSIHVQFDFFNAENNIQDKLVLTDVEGHFKVPAGMDHYDISLINLNNQYFEFNYLLIEPLDSSYHVEVTSENFKIVMAWDDQLAKIDQINVKVLNRVLNSGAYALNPEALMVYIEVDTRRIRNAEQNEAQLHKCVDFIQSVLKKQGIDGHLSTIKIEAQRKADDQLMVMTQQLEEMLSNLGD